MENSHAKGEMTEAMPRSTSATPHCCATIGFFDGVHLGHAYLISQVRQAAMERGLASAVVTFPLHPRQALQTDYRPQLLLTPEEKAVHLKATGIERCITIDFTRALSQLTARQFMTLLAEQYGVRALVIGYDHRFGHGREEGFADYVRHGGEIGMEVLPALAYEQDGLTVSSSQVRRLLSAGEVGAAAQCLGYEYYVQGKVEEGYGAGHALGYPTANLHPDFANKLIPADGVYAVRVMTEEKTYGGMMNIGFHPTLNADNHRTLEVNVFDFSGNLYGRTLRVCFVSQLRHERKFLTPERLSAQLKADEAEARQALRMG